MTVWVFYRKVCFATHWSFKRPLFKKDIKPTRFQKNLNKTKQFLFDYNHWDLQSFAHTFLNSKRAALQPF